MSFLLSNIIILRILIKSVKLIWTFIFAFKFIEYSLQTNSIKLHIYFRKLSSLKVILLKKGKGKKTPKRYYMLQRISWWWFNNNATNKPNYLTLQLPDPVKNYLWWLMTHFSSLSWFMNCYTWCCKHWKEFQFNFEHMIFF